VYVALVPVVIHCEWHGIPPLVRICGRVFKSLSGERIQLRSRTPGVRQRTSRQQGIIERNPGDGTIIYDALHQETATDQRHSFQIERKTASVQDPGSWTERSGIIHSEDPKKLMMTGYLARPAARLAWERGKQWGFAILNCAVQWTDHAAIEASSCAVPGPRASRRVLMLHHLYSEIEADLVVLSSG
jgi:hypothetical protein